MHGSGKLVRFYNEGFCLLGLIIIICLNIWNYFEPEDYMTGNAT